MTARRMQMAGARTMIAAFAMVAALSNEGPAQATPPQSAQQAQNFIFQTTPLPGTRAFGGSAVLGGYYYYLGGSYSDEANKGATTPTASVVYAPVLPDGRLGEWKETTPLPQPRHYIDASTLVLNDVVYIVGGSSKAQSGERYNTTLYSRPLPNGALLPWAESQPLPQTGLSAASAISTPGHVHVIGGLGQGGKASPKVWTNEIYADGSMGSWSEGPALPAGLWYHSAGTVSGRVYVWGGLSTTNSKSASAQVFSAPILGSGRLGEWKAEPSSLPTPFYGATSAVAGNFLLSFMPRYAGGASSDETWFSIVTPTGLGEWRPKQTPVPNKRFHSSAVDYRRGLILFGGGREEAGSKMRKDLWFFQLGSAARDSAERTWLAHQRAHLNTVAAFQQSPQGDESLSYVAAARLPVSAAAGFRTYDQARTESVTARKPLVLYFHAEGTRPCTEQVQQFATAEFASAVGGACWAWVETKDNPQLAQQIGVYRVPTWVFYDRQGNEIQQARTVGVKSGSDLAAVVKAIP